MTAIRSNSSSSSSTGGAFCSVGVRNWQLLCGVEGDHLGAVGGDDHLLLDARRRETVRGRAVGLQREDHALLDLRRVLQRVEPADDRPLVQPEAKAVAELQAERLYLIIE